MEACAVNNYKIVVGLCKISVISSFIWPEGYLVYVGCMNNAVLSEHPLSFHNLSSFIRAL